MKLAIIGNPSTGKTSLFYSLVKGHSRRQKGYFSSIGTFTSKDRRVIQMGRLVKSQKITPVSYQVGDFDGFGKLWKEDKAATIIQELVMYDVLIHVINNFSGSNPERDFDDLNLRLIFADLQFVENRISKLKKEVNAKKAQRKELELLEKIHLNLLSEKPISFLKLKEHEKKLISGYPFITIKPRILVLNVSEDLVKEPCPSGYKELPTICASLNIEREVAEINNETTRTELLNEYGIKESAVSKLEDIILKELGYIIFYTVGDKETRAWLLRKGASAFEAAGKIHSDIQRGFIRAEVIHYSDFIKAGSHKEAKKLNLMHLEGKDYIVQDGDVINIRFSI